MSEKNRDTIVFLCIILCLCAMFCASCIASKTQEYLSLDFTEGVYSEDTNEHLFSAYKTALLCYYDKMNEQEKKLSLQDKDFSTCEPELKILIEKWNTILRTAGVFQKSVDDFCLYIEKKAERFVSAFVDRKTNNHFLYNEAFLSLVQGVCTFFNDSIGIDNAVRISVTFFQYQTEKELIDLEKQQQELKKETINRVQAVACISQEEASEYVLQLCSIWKEWKNSEENQKGKEYAYSEGEQYSYDNVQEGEYLSYKALSQAVQDGILTVEKANSIAVNAKTVYQNIVGKRNQYVQNVEDLSYTQTLVDSEILNVNTETILSGEIAESIEHILENDDEYKKVSKLHALLQEDRFSEDFCFRIVHAGITILDYVIDNYDSLSIEKLQSQKGINEDSSTLFTAENIHIYLPFFRFIADVFLLVDWQNFVELVANYADILLLYMDFTPQFSNNVYTLLQSQTVQAFLSEVIYATFDLIGKVSTIEDKDIIMISEYLRCKDKSGSYYDIQYQSQYDTQTKGYIYYVCVFAEPLSVDDWKKQMNDKNTKNWIIQNASYSFSSYEQMSSWLDLKGYHITSYYLEKYYDKDDQEIPKSAYNQKKLCAIQYLVKTVCQKLEEYETLENTIYNLLEEIEDVFGKYKLLYSKIEKKQTIETIKTDISTMTETDYLSESYDGTLTILDTLLSDGMAFFKDQLVCLFY